MQKNKILSAHFYTSDPVQIYRESQKHPKRTVTKVFLTMEQHEAQQRGPTARTSTHVKVLRPRPLNKGPPEVTRGAGERAGNGERRDGHLETCLFP